MHLKPTFHWFSALMVVALASGGQTRACQENPGKPTISVSGAQAGNANYYAVELPKTGTVSVTISASGDTPCPTGGEKCKCNDQTKDPEADGSPVYTFSKTVGNQDPADGPTVKWDVTSSSSPGEYKFKVTKIDQKYKACAQGWTGGVSSKSNTQASDEVTVLVYKLETETVATQPTDRQRTKVGVGEEVNLTIQPSSVTASWSVDGGSSNGSVSPPSGASTKYTAADEAAMGNVKAEFKGITKTTTFNVTQPSGIKLEASSSTNNKNPLRSGFIAKIYITPADVNFEKVKIYEGTGTSIATGYFSSLNGVNHAQGPDLSPSGFVANKGTQLAATDTVTTHANVTPYSNGVFRWPIQWHYKLGSANKPVVILEHKGELKWNASTSTATLETTKGGESATETNP